MLPIYKEALIIVYIRDKINKQLVKIVERALNLGFMEDCKTRETCLLARF